MNPRFQFSSKSPIASENSSLDEQQILRGVTECFHAQFLQSYRSKLRGGSEEPLYAPADASSEFNTIFYTRNYLSSALHEASHWCIAGEQRRKLEDYGYWYKPDGRNQCEQMEFERIEVKPQALEWIFSEATGIRFKVSADNLASELGASPQFKRDIHAQVLSYCAGPMPERAKIFAAALAAYFNRPKPFDPALYSLDTLF